MGLNDALSADRAHISFFGLRNAGKSSLVNAVTGQSLAVVSDVPGTTTDPVSKAMELLPAGPVVITDTPGIDDEGELGAERVRRALRVLEKTDVAVLVTDGTRQDTPAEKELTALFEERKIPYIVAVSKSDLGTREAETPDAKNAVTVSALTGDGIYELKELIARLAKGTETERRIVADLISPGDAVVLVTPIDSAAPKGRLILPQQQTIRDILDTGAFAFVTKEDGLARCLGKLTSPPRLVITDSQAFEEVAKTVPETVPLTSFSILFSRYKGYLAPAVEGAEKLSGLRDGDRVLISEGCTHHRQCGDIGTVKLPAMIKKFSRAEPEFSFTSGGDFPDDLAAYSLVIHCGGCMLTEREVGARIEKCLSAGVPVTNYGTAIAKMKGILERSIAPLGL